MTRLRSEGLRPAARDLVLRHCFHGCLQQPGVDRLGLDWNEPCHIDLLLTRGRAPQTPEREELVRNSAVILDLIRPTIRERKFAWAVSLCGATDGVLSLDAGEGRRGRPKPRWSAAAATAAFPPSAPIRRGPQRANGVTVPRLPANWTGAVGFKVIVCRARAWRAARINVKETRVAMMSVRAFARVRRWHASRLAVVTNSMVASGTCGAAVEGEPFRGRSSRLRQKINAQMHGASRTAWASRHDDYNLTLKADCLARKAEGRRHPILSPLRNASMSEGDCWYCLALPLGPKNLPMPIHRIFFQGALAYPTSLKERFKIIRAPPRRMAQIPPKFGQTWSNVV